MPEFMYYILSVKHSPGFRGYALWWGPDDSGYVEDLNQAGRYTREQVEQRSRYYNDGESTMAIREDYVIDRSMKLGLAPHSVDWEKLRFKGDEPNT